jgi:transposase
MSTTFVKIPYTERVELRQQANYWRFVHSRAVEREAVLKEEVKELKNAMKQARSTNLQLRKTISEKDKEIEECRQKIEALKAKLVWLKQQIFGRKTEQSTDEMPGESDRHLVPSPSPGDDSSQEKRSRGQQRGSKGHGRKLRTNLPYVEQYHNLPPAGCFCPECNSPFLLLPGTEDSEEIEWEVIIRRRIHKRSRYVPSCDCKAVPGIITAPAPDKLIPKGMFGVSFWVRLLMDKFLFQRPLYRTRKMLALEGLDVSQGTLTGGLQRIGEMLQPVYVSILEHSRGAGHWKMDETHWLVFEEIEGKTGYRWWLWVMITADTVVYLLDPTRSAQVPRNYLGENPEGIITADRYGVYKNLGENIQVAFCWAHVRRDFIKVRDGYTELYQWAGAWIKRIDDLFHLNSVRVAAIADSCAFEKEDESLRKAVDDMAGIRDRELGRARLHTAARKTLERMLKHWEGCVLFVDKPEIPMDNNESERMLRNPVVGRKNYYGSGSVWSGILATIIFTIFQTLLKNNIDPQKWLFEYFNACADNGGKPPEDINAFLPWQFSEEKKQAMYFREYPP